MTATIHDLSAYRQRRLDELTRDLGSRLAADLSVGDGWDLGEIEGCGWALAAVHSALLRRGLALHRRGDRIEVGPKP